MDKLKPLSFKDIDLLVDKQWERFKQYGNIETLRKDNPQLEPKTVNTLASYVIFKPDPFDKEKHENYNAIDIFREKLFQLSSLQERYWTFLRSGNKESADDLLNEINNEWNTLFGKPDEIAFVQEDCNKTLQRIFSKISWYFEIMRMLVEKDFVEDHTYIWKDEQKGAKATLCAILKALKVKGYYKEDIIVDNKLLVDIAKNSFKLVIAIETMKKAKPNDHLTSFIPIASTLP